MHAVCASRSLQKTCFPRFSAAEQRKHRAVFGAAWMTASPQPAGAAGAARPGAQFGSIRRAWAESMPLGWLAQIKKEPIRVLITTTACYSKQQISEIRMLAVGPFHQSRLTGSRLLRTVGAGVPNLGSSFEESMNAR